MADVVVPLLDQTGRWTHRDRHRHHRFEIDVPDRTIELRVRFRWGPPDMGSEHEQNSVAMTLFGPEGFRGAATSGTPGDQQITIGDVEASLGALVGPIPAGPWTINVDTGGILNDGAETGHLTYRLEAAATVGDTGSRAAGVGTSAPAPALAGDHADPRPSTDEVPAERRWYRGDLHSHTVHSDGIITVEDRVRGAVERGLDFLAITDHNTVSHHRELAGWPEAITPIRASEVTTFHGHLNCFGLERLIDWRADTRGTGAAGIVDQAHRQNALISINHPNAFGDPWCTGCHWDFALVDFTAIDAMEIWNGRWAIPETANDGALAFWTDLLDAGYRLTAISGTDSHSAEEDRYIALPSTYVHAADRSERAILDAIRLGHVFLSSAPTVSFRARGSGGAAVTLPGDRMSGDGRVDLEADIDAVETPATLWFVTSGSMSAIGECGRGRTRVTRPGLTATKWWRLEVRDGTATNGDLRAITNPVYLTA